jgi:hypothetical protein
MNEIQRQIQAVADSHGIPFEDAVKSTCQSLQAAHGDKDVKFRYDGQGFRAMERIKDPAFYELMNAVAMSRLKEWEAIA